MSKLTDTLALLGELDETSRQEELMRFADRVKTPTAQETFDFVAIRTEPNCADKVGVFLRFTGNKITLRISLGPNVQALTRAFAGILTDAFDNVEVSDINALTLDQFQTLTGALSPRRIASLNYLIGRIQEGQLQLAPT